MRPNLQTRPHFWPQPGTPGNSAWTAERLQGLLVRASLQNVHYQDLLKEKDPEMFFHALLQMGRRLEAKGAFPEAAELYSALSATNAQGAAAPEGVRQAALARLRAIAGGGSTGDRFEFLTGNFLSDAASPELLIGMTAAGMASAMTRAFLPPSRILSPLLALSAEAVAFPLTTRAAARALGRETGLGPQGIGGEIASSFLLLGAMRVAGWAGMNVGRALRPPAGTRPALQHAAMFGGILAGQELQRRMGLLPADAHATRLTDALALWLHFQVGGHLSGKLLGRPWGTESGEAPGKSTGPRRILESLLPHAMPAIAGTATLAPAPMWMSSGKPEVPGMPWLSNLPTEVRIRIKDSAPQPASLNVLSAQQVGELRKVAANIPPSLERVEALARLGFRAAQAGEAGALFFQEAEGLVDQLDTPVERSVAWGRIGLELHRSGDAAGAVKFFQASFREAGRIRKSFFSSKMVSPAHWREYLQWIAELHGSPDLKDLAARALALAHQVRERLATLGRAELLNHQVVLRLARLGQHREALELSHATGSSSDLALETRIRMARIFLEHGDRIAARNILTVLEGAVDVEDLRSELAVDFLKTSQYTQFREQWALLQTPFHRIDCLLKGAQLYRSRAETLSSIHLTMEAETIFSREFSGLSAVKRARLHAKLARLLGQNPQRELSDPHLREAIDLFKSIFQPGKKMQRDGSQALAEIFLAASVRYGENYVDSLLKVTHPEDRLDILRNISLTLNEEGKLGLALLWAHKLQGEARDGLQKDLALSQLNLGASWIALDLAKRIQGAVPRYQTLLHIYLNQEGSAPGSPFSPPTRGGGSAPAEDPKPNAGSLGHDGVQGKEFAPLKLDEGMVASVPWFLLASPDPAAPSAAPLFLHLDGSPSTGPVPPAKVIWDSAPVRDKDGAAPPSSDPPPNELGFSAEAHAWVDEMGFGLAEVRLVEAFLDKIYRQMWSVLNFHSGSGLAHRLATGKLLTLRITPKDQTLMNYSVEFLDSPQAPQADFNMVQFTFDPATGSLSPQDYIGHLRFEIQAAEKNIDVQRFFSPFYRRVDLISPGLIATRLLAALPQEIQQMAAKDPTLYKPLSPPKPAPAPLPAPSPVPAPKSQEPAPLLVSYRPLIFEGSRIEVDRYADYQDLPESGRKRLHRLVQHILAALHSRESKIELPENRVLRTSPGVHVIIGPNPDTPGQKNIEVLTMSEAFQRQRKKPLSEDEVLLVLLRYTGMGGENYNYPHLEQHYTKALDVQGFPTGADLEFQNTLGLRGPLHLRLEFLNLQPNNLQEWDQWMAENGYYQASHRETVN